nr:MAG TPA: hypothetical protein [Caudoviricetes sp.]
MKMLGQKVKDRIITARPIKIHKGAYNGRQTYDLINVMDVIHGINWMSNPENKYNCGECRSNTGSKKDLPCGQQNCWVSCTTR